MLDKPLVATTSTASVSQQSSLMLSGPMRVDLSVYRGDSGTFRITVSEPDGNPADLTGAAWDGDIRLKASDAEVITNFEIVPVAGDLSSIDVVLSSAKSEMLTSTCVYDIEMRLGTIVATLIQGTITVTQDVSRPT